MTIKIVEKQSTLPKDIIEIGQYQNEKEIQNLKRLKEKARQNRIKISQDKKGKLARIQKLNVSMSQPNLIVDNRSQGSTVNRNKSNMGSMMKSYEIEAVNTTLKPKMLDSKMRTFGRSSNPLVGIFMGDN